MVFLKRVATVQGSRSAVFQWLANFENAEKWDPGTLSSQRSDGGASPAGIGTTYDLLTTFKGNESSLVYKVVEWQENFSVKLEGDGEKAFTIDEIKFADGQQVGTTQVTYEADIRVKGILGFLAGPLLGGAFQNLADGAINGIVATCKEKFQ